MTFAHSFTTHSKIVECLENISLDAFLLFPTISIAAPRMVLRYASRVCWDDFKATLPPFLGSLFLQWFHSHL